MQPQNFQRNTANKMSALAILNAPYQRVEGTNPNFLLWNGMEIYRINLIGIIVQKSDSELYVGFLIDDGTATISCRYFEMEKPLPELDIGNVVNVIGRPREYNAEKYLLIETMHKVDARWMHVRKLEMQNVVDEPAIEHEEILMQNPADRVLKQIKELDMGDGVSIESLSSSKEIDELVDTLLRDGSIFEVKPGKVKVLE